MKGAAKEKLIVVGAGASGLMAAAQLCERFDITVLEAQPRIGGRIHTLPGGREAGAEFVHGDLPLTTELIQKAKSRLEPAKTTRYSVNECRWIEHEEMITGWNDLLQAMGRVTEDTTLDAFLETHFADPQFETLRREARAYASGFDLADPVRASVKGLYREWSAEATRLYRVKEGYQSIIRYLADLCQQKGVRIRQGKTVRSVDWKTGEVIVHTADGDRYEASKLIVTIPVGVHQQTQSDCHISFDPVLDIHDTAWQQIGYGAVLKLLLSFRKPFWNESENSGFIVSEQPIPTWWTNRKLLTGWVGGPSALQWNLIPDEQVLEHAVQSLAAIFGTTAGEIVDLLEDHRIIRWHERGAAMGGYSYTTPYTHTARKILSQPVADTIYFAGEGLYEGDAQGTVEAALASGQSVACRILEESPAPYRTDAAL